MKKLLVFQHEFREHPSRINLYALVNGIELDVLRLWEPYEIPEGEGYDAVIILGGSMNVRDDFPSKNDEVAFIRKNIDKVPMLGICLGGQLIAHTLGANVGPMMQNGEHTHELGSFPVTITEKGKNSPLFKGFPQSFTVTQIHGDTFDIPDGAEHLAVGDNCENQAFSYGRKTFGVQFHLEYTPYALAHIFAKNKQWLKEKADEAEGRLLDESFQVAPRMQEDFDRLMDNFLSV